jgi:hypothetical protein
MMRSCSDLRRDTRGVTVIEYLIVLALVPLAGLASWHMLRGSTHERAEEVARRIVSLEPGGAPPTAEADPRAAQPISARSGAEQPRLLLLAAAPARDPGPGDPGTSDDVPYEDLPEEASDDPPPRKHHWYDGPLDVAKGAWNFTRDTAVDLGYRGVALLQATGQHAGPLAIETAATAGGIATMLLGAGGEVGGVALDLTGVGALVGVPVNVLSAGVIVTGAVVTSTGLLAMAQEGGSIGRDAQSNYENNRPSPPDTSEWGKGSFGSAEDSVSYHFEQHGAEVGASDEAQYVRKAEGFKQNLRGATKSRVRGAVEGVTRYKKNGRYIDLAPDGSIISFGAE